MRRHNSSYSTRANTLNLVSKRKDYAAPSATILRLPMPCTFGLLTYEIMRCVEFIKGCDTCLAHLWASADFVPRSEVLGTPKAAGVMQPRGPLVGHF